MLTCVSAQPTSATQANMFWVKVGRSSAQVNHPDSPIGWVVELVVPVIG